MSNIIDTLKSKSGFKYCKYITPEQLKSAEKELGLSFSFEYSAYLFAFGAASFYGHELTGICESKRRNVVDVTLEQRSLNPQIPADFYVVEETHIDGIVIWQDKKGRIYQSSPNREPQQIAASLEEFVCNC